MHKAGIYSKNYKSEMLGMLETILIYNKKIVKAY